MSLCGFQVKTMIIMKKFFISIMAVVALAACSKEEAVEVQKGDAIAFGDAFVDNATKAIYDEASDLEAFKVWGNVKGINATPLALYGEDGANVTYNTNWDCDVVRYWTPLANYNFTAIANGVGQECENGIPTTISYTQNGGEPADLVYGTATATTSDVCLPTGDIVDGRVAFTLRHLLARVQVQFTNQIAPDYTYNITNVKINTAKTGVYTIANAADSDPATIAWAPAAEKVDLPYTNVTGLAATPKSAGAQLIIPGAPVVLSFDYDLIFDETVIYSATSVTKTVTTKLAEGNSYNLNVVLKAGNEIDFTIKALTDWTSDTTVDIQ